MSDKVDSLENRKASSEAMFMILENNIAPFNVDVLLYRMWYTASKNSLPNNRVHGNPECIKYIVKILSAYNHNHDYPMTPLRTHAWYRESCGIINDALTQTNQWVLSDGALFYVQVAGVTVIGGDRTTIMQSLTKRKDCIDHVRPGIQGRNQSGDWIVKIWEWVSATHRTWRIYYSRFP